MTELPCVGAGITVIDPGPSSDEVFRKRMDGRPSVPKKSKRRAGLAFERVGSPRLLRASVTGHDEVDTGGVYWACGSRCGRVILATEGTTWVRGHGPQARGALLAARALERQR